ncbi:hypothetical protein [Helicobacter pylori]|uniref:hypothetical protein n=1 Tax=Helicobacter pylori TaxID=210 RepID=UPI0012FD9420|nr:hypothetical protein [Helicobacter pylori]
MAFIQSFNHSIIQSFNHSIIQSFNHSIIQSFNHSIIQSFNHSIIQAIKQRYHNFYQNRFKNPLLFIIPPFINPHRNLFKKFDSISPIFQSVGLTELNSKEK